MVGESFDPERLFEELFFPWHLLKAPTDDIEAWKEERCRRVHTSIQSIDLVSHYLATNNLAKAHDELNAKRVQDPGSLDSFKSKLDRRMRLEQVRSLLLG